MSTKSPAGGETAKKRQTQRDVVRFNLYLPRESYESLVQLQSLSGKSSFAETIRAALRLYHTVHEGIENGKEVHLIDKKSKEKEKLVSL